MGLRMRSACRALRNARPNRHTRILIILRVRCSHIWISSRALVVETICSRPTRGPASRRINSCLERHQPSAADDHDGIFAAENMQPPRAVAGCIADLATTVALINPQGVEFTRIFPCFERQTLTDLLDA